MPTATQQMKMVRVRFQDSIAGLKDPTESELEQRYLRARRDMSRDGVEPYKADEKIREMRELDAAYTKHNIGKDFAFKPGDERFVSAGIAEKWSASGVCEIIAAA